MTTSEHTAESAAGWIEAWVRMDFDWLRRNLAPGFVHASPFGRLEGHEFYLETVEPLARKSVQKLEVKEVVGDENRAAIWFENRIASGLIPSCDWLQIEDGRITDGREHFFDLHTWDAFWS